MGDLVVGGRWVGVTQHQQRDRNDPVSNSKGVKWHGLKTCWLALCAVLCVCGQLQGVMQTLVISLGLLVGCCGLSGEERKNTLVIPSSST